MKPHHITKAIQKAPRGTPDHEGTDERKMLLHFFKTGGEFDFISRMKKADVLNHFFKWMMDEKPTRPSEWTQEGKMLDILMNYADHEDIPREGDYNEYVESDLKHLLWTDIGEHWEETRTDLDDHLEENVSKDSENMYDAFLAIDELGGKQKDITKVADHCFISDPLWLAAVYYKFKKRGMDSAGDTLMQDKKKLRNAEKRHATKKRKGEWPFKFKKTNEDDETLHPPSISVGDEVKVGNNTFKHK